MDILPELRKRHSPLIFEEIDGEESKLELLIETVRGAPSCFNNQSWNYVFVHHDHSSRGVLEEALSFGNDWVKKAPYLFAVSADREEDCQTNGLPYIAYDVGLSFMCLAMEAEHQGLRVHQMAGWNEVEVKNALGFPEDTE